MKYQKFPRQITRRISLDYHAVKMLNKNWFTSAFTHFVVIFVWWTDAYKISCPKIQFLELFCTFSRGKIQYLLIYYACIFADIINTWMLTRRVRGVSRSFVNETTPRFSKTRFLPSTQPLYSRVAYYTQNRSTSRLSFFSPLICISFSNDWEICTIFYILTFFVIKLNAAFLLFSVFMINLKKPESWRYRRWTVREFRKP